MTNEALTVLAIISMVIWIAVSKEAVKPLNEVNRRKMIALTSAGTLSAIVITTILFQNLLF
ncbi:hypothetical protein JOC25_000108 [Solibacillus kalamii]|uniref:Uncharacterized protein n=1 Tax=Solibacillus kalamii TaxID=1748298 RepID=A0ABX3ZH91_9BACL|nr:hypothetical protein [Solibacillus kalamii]MBM7663652.1 hypothetical protein [Solibacillus kalamii]OUZ39094.1 hypothetical protein CBM15_09510 [Solibacillus kalamii]